MKMQCFPLYTLLLALGNPTVDFLSLDIEVSLAVFQVIPNLNCSTKGSRIGGVTDYSMVKGALLFKYMILFANFYFKIFVLWWKSVSLKEIHTLRWISKLSVLRPSFSTWRQGLTSQYLPEGSQHDKCDIKISHKIVFFNLSGKNFSTCSPPMATLILLLLQGFLQSRLRKGANKTITVGLFCEKEIPIFFSENQTLMGEKNLHLSQSCKISNLVHGSKSSNHILHNIIRRCVNGEI